GEGNRSSSINPSGKRKVSSSSNEEISGRRERRVLIVVGFYVFTTTMQKDHLQARISLTCIRIRGEESRSKGFVQRSFQRSWTCHFRSACCKSRITSSSSTGSRSA